MNNDALDAITLRVGEANLSNACSRDGCHVSLQDVPSHRVVVDADTAFQTHGIHGKRCDYVLFFFLSTGNHTLHTVPIELKSGDFKASEVREQLQNGAAFTDLFAPPDVIFRPILFCGNKIHWAQRKKLERAKVRFRNQPFTIITARCDRPRNLMDALKPTQ